MLQITQHEISTAEAAEVFSVTRKTIALWSQQGIMVKLRHGVFDLKKSLKNWAEYQRCIFEGADDPLALWQIRQEIAWSEANPRPDYSNLDLSNIELVDLETFEVELDAAGRITRARRAVEAKGAGA